ncbi:MAG: aspartate kinase [Verrucomicrobia bacterium]|nr:aspartate kinase [Verrucomicrobiota bacterium]
MSIVVQKYGGSSVADAECIRRVAARVVETQRAGHQVCVVVSAMGDTTDELLARAKSLSANPPRRELDMLLSAGERIAMALLCTAIHALGGDAISFTGSQSGIITNDRHSDARIIEVRPFRVQDELERGRIVVVAGYQGVSYKKEVTTLGRGGSDTTAVALAAALGAAWCEICSDVDGVYSADPRVVPQARRLAQLSYEETQEMAEAGAQVLNAQAVEFAKERGIAIYARATMQPPPSPPPRGENSTAVAADGGTVVRRFAPRQPGSVAAVVSERDVVMLHAAGPAAGEELLGVLEAHGAIGKQLQLAAFNQSIADELDLLSLVLSRENLHAENVLRAELAEKFGRFVKLIDGLGAVSVIGAGINASYANLLAGGACLRDAGLAPHSAATSSFRITWLVERARLPEAVRALHARFIESQVAPVP